MKLPVRTALTHKLVVAAAVALLASGAAMGAFASQDKLPGKTHHVTSTQIESTSTSTATATSTANPNEQGTPRAIKGIPTDNPQHHPEDGDGVCDKGETAVKTTPSGVMVNVPCQAVEGGMGAGHDKTPHANRTPDDADLAGDETPDASETPEADETPGGHENGDHGQSGTHDHGDKTPEPAETDEAD